MQIQTTMTYHLTWSAWPSSKNLQTKNAGGGVEKRGPSYTVGENVNAVLHSTSMENSICCAVLNRFQFSSVAQSCPTLCNPMNPSTPGLPVHHHLPEFTQTHVHRVGDTIQPSHPLSSPSPPAPNPSQHQSLFQ